MINKQDQEESILSESWRKCTHRRSRISRLEWISYSLNEDDTVIISKSINWVENEYLI